MKKYIIAGLVVAYEPKFSLLEKRSERFLAPENAGDPQIIIDIPTRFFEEKVKQHPMLTIEESEYLYVGGEFFRQLVYFGGCLLHSSTVVMDGNAYMFSADPGTGKSTHTSLWLKEFGSRAYILNDDKPCLMSVDGRFYACGCPFSGKTDLGVDGRVPVKGICFIERAAENSIERLGAKEIIMRFFAQTHRPTDSEGMEKILFLLNDLCGKVPFYRLNCNMDLSAARLAYSRMSTGE